MELKVTDGIRDISIIRDFLSINIFSLKIKIELIFEPYIEWAEEIKAFIKLWSKYFFYSYSNFYTAKNNI